jgi:hypothetical protein
MPDFRMNARRIPLPLVVCLALVLPACSSSTPTIGDAIRAVVVVTVDPNPITGAQNPLTAAVTATYKVVLTETAGLGGTVNFVSSSVYDPATGLQVAINYFDSSDLVVFVGTSRLEPNGTLNVPQTLSYLLPGLSTAATLTVSTQLTDDRGNLVNSSILVPIDAPATTTQ